MPKIVDLNAYRDPKVRKLLELGKDIDNLIFKYTQEFEPHEVGVIIAQRLSMLTTHITVDKEAYIDIIIEFLIKNGDLSNGG